MTAQAAERAAVMDAAYRTLIASKGTSVSVTDVLRNAGLSTRAFYRHFESKDELLLALFRRDAERVTGQLDAAARSQSPRDALASCMATFLRIAADPRRRRRMLVLSSEEVTRARGYVAERQRFEAAQEAAIAAILERGLIDGSFPWARPASDARSIRAALGKAFDEQVARSTSRTAEETAAEVIDFALRAVGAQTVPDR
ncbi:TetR/AcrR family transcriptional regulator [Pseudonocardia kunmingensis]|uniref:TetR family transcriptional regulator n=1 Tax=Pseudonocardia kunmingensis TaxID=630975 RepID=A0A543DPC2_9PSEU|nr:TetR/AcrR family transcriptional regulator [Pseudonocardia kunmingensis]TQM11182.1 TetR family transcriptional regulator [Pseudonocardia kunmingensis]